MSFGVSDLPAVNAALNATAAVLLLLGRRAIKAGDRARHKAFMISATAVSAAFLACYLTYHATHGTTRFTTDGWPRALYLTILGTHTVLAAVNLPLLVILLRLVWRGRFSEHKRLARYAWPSWLYVSVTGVVIYLMLYQIWPGSLQPLASTVSSIDL
ncbi:MAG: DUF420 domain-containing protein [Deltaproteobacteria bacterium]|nr:DUF420 domain-containing protein [Deltaproteobacteria bacterium]